MHPAPEPAPAAATAGDHLLPLSARSDGALAELGARYVVFLRRLAEREPDAAGEVCFTAGVGRSHHPHRLAVVGQSCGELAAALEGALGRGEDAAAPLLEAPPGNGEIRGLLDDARARSLALGPGSEVVARILAAQGNGARERPSAVLETVAALYTSGFGLDWRALDPRGGRTR